MSDVRWQFLLLHSLQLKILLESKKTFIRSFFAPPAEKSDEKNLSIRVPRCLFCSGLGDASDFGSGLAGTKTSRAGPCCASLLVKQMDGYSTDGQTLGLIAGDWNSGYSSRC